MTIVSEKEEKEGISLPSSISKGKQPSASSISSRSLIKAEEADAAIADAAGTLFHFPQFVEQFIVQALVPLSIIYLVIAHSWAAAANVLSVPRPFSCIFAVIFFFAQLISMMPIVVFISWILRGNSDGINDASTSVLRVDIVAVAAAFVMHRLAISIKYAYQPMSIYERRMSAWVTYQERLDDQLFASWFKLSRATIEREVKAALDTIEEEDASSSYSLSQETFSRLRAGVNKEARVDLDSCTIDNTSQNRCLPVGVLAAVLIVHVNEETSGYVLALQRLTSCIGLISMFSTTVLRAALSIPILGTSTYDSCVIIAAWISNFLLLPTIFTFIAVGIVDHARRKLALETLSRLLQPSPLRSGGRSTVGILASAVQPAVLPLENISNVRAFLAVRSLLLAFGAGFHARLVTVISGDLIVLAVVTIYCVISALTAPTTSGVAVITSSLVLHHSLVVPAVALCALGLYMAAEANTAAFQSTAVIAQTRLFMRVASGRTSHDIPPPVFGLLDDVEKVLRENAEPITVLGIAATPVLTNSLVGGFFSVETLLVSGAIARLSSGVSSSPSSSPTSSSSTSSPPSSSPSPSATSNNTGGTSTVTNSSSSSLIEVNVGIFFGAITALSIVIALVILFIKRRRSSTSLKDSNKREDFETEHKITISANEKEHETGSIKINNNPMTSVLVDKTPVTKENVKEEGDNVKCTTTTTTTNDDDNDISSSLIKTTSISTVWVQHEDIKSGEIWFENTETGETCWEMPVEEPREDRKEKFLNNTKNVHS
jgi:hypothetical protein